MRLHCSSAAKKNVRVHIVPVFTHIRTKRSVRKQLEQSGDCYMHTQAHSHEAHISKAVDDVFPAQTYSQTVEMLGTSISFPHCSEELRAHSDQVQTRQSRTELRSGNIAMATCYPSYELPTQPSRTVQVPVQKDYSRPLHVDCSVEYELPNQAKPPQGVRNEPLLMIHPCYFRKIESQRRSPFVNNLPPTTRQPSATKRRIARTQQQIPQQIPQQAAQYPIQYTTTAATTERQQQPQQQQHHLHHQQLWEPMPPLVPISAAAAVQQTYCKREAAMVSGCGTYSSGSGDSGHWTDPDRSPDRPEDKHILTGKYRQYLRAHRLHPYVSSAIPIASTFPQIQQVCYNV